MSAPPQTFVRKEREHLDVLRGRLAWLSTPAAAEAPRGAENGFFQGESAALAWALGVIEGSVDPVELRVERIEHQLRKLAGRQGKLERDFYEEQKER